MMRMKTLKGDDASTLKAIAAMSFKLPAASVNGPGTMWPEKLGPKWAGGREAAGSNDARNG